MFAKFKSGNQAPVSTVPSILDGHPICQYYEVGKLIASAGPELAWKIHESTRKSDGKECSVFIFDKKVAEKLHKPRRKETVCELLKNSIKTMERFRHPKVLQVLHTVEESADALAFSAEPIYASMANIFAYQEAKLVEKEGPPPPNAVPPQNKQQSVFSEQMVQQMPEKKVPPLMREYHFLDLEVKYGFLQIVEALSYLHYSGHVIHRHVCPQSILVTRRGTWKLAGFEFLEKMNEADLNDSVPCQPWTNRVSKLAQPTLDYIAPECQFESKCSMLSDMWGIGLVICAVYNNGRQLIQAGNIIANYIKQLEGVPEIVKNVVPRVPIPIQEAVARLTSREPTIRPSSQILQLIKYFANDPAVNALKFLDVVNMKDTTQKSHFYKTTLMEAMPMIPRKLWWQNVWPILQNEIHNGEVLAAVLQPVITLIQEATVNEYERIMGGTMKIIFNSPKSIQATVTLLENLHLIMEKTQPNDVTTDIIPMLFFAFESSTIQVQSAAVVAVTNVYDSIMEASIRRLILPKVKSVYEKNLADPKIVQNVLIFIERWMDKLDKIQVMEEVLAMLSNVRIPEPDIVMRTVRIYHRMMVDKSYGMTVELLATHVLPLLIPHTVNPGLNLEQYCILVEVLQEMLEQIDRQQRNKLKLDNISNSPDRFRTLRHQYSTDNMNAPVFNIPNLRIDQRKTSSAEDMGRKNSAGSGILGGWWFGNSPSSPDSNFLRVSNVFPNRRLSDNTLMTPKIRIAPSCASSPGGTPGSGLPTRRHSSIGPQERRGSTINLSPPTTYGFGVRGNSGSSLSVPSTSGYVGGSMPNTSSSVPFLLTSSMQSIRSRRTSNALSSGPLGSGSGLLQQIGSGVVRQITSVSGHASPAHHLTVSGARNYVRKCPSLNITFSQ